MTPSLSESDQQLIANNLAQLPPDLPLSSSVTLAGVVDGRGLACPLPLLKTKVALRGVPSGESLYVVATDPNSRADIAAFCQQSQGMGGPILTLALQHQSLADPSFDSTMMTPTPIGGARDKETPEVIQNKVSTANSDTLFHFIITKTDSN